MYFPLSSLFTDSMGKYLAVTSTSSVLSSWWGIFFSLFFAFGSGVPSGVKHQCDGHFAFIIVAAVEAAPTEMKKAACFKNLVLLGNN